MKQQSVSYRLKQVDFDGSIDTAGLIVVKTYGPSTSITDVVIYPNPFESSINLVHNFDDVILVEVKDVMGSMVLFKETNETSSVVDLKELNPGLYIITVNSSTTSKTFKVIKR